MKFYSRSKADHCCLGSRWERLQRSKKESSVGGNSFLNLAGGRDTGEYKLAKNSSSCTHLHVNYNKVDLKQWHINEIRGNRIRVPKDSCVV